MGAAEMSAVTSPNLPRTIGRVGKIWGLLNESERTFITRRRFRREIARMASSIKCFNKDPPPFSYPLGSNLRAAATTTAAAALYIPQDYPTGGESKNGGGTHVLGYLIPCRTPLSNQTLVDNMLPFHGRYTCVGFRPTSTGSAGYVAY